MLKLLNKEVFLDEFSTDNLYNEGRCKGDIWERDFLTKCLKKGIIKVKTFIIEDHNNEFLYEELRGEDYIFLESKLREYPRENINNLKSMFRIYKKLKSDCTIEFGKEVIGDIGRSTIRMYIKDWNLAINPSTQTINDLLILCTQDLNICIVNHFFDAGIVGFLLEVDENYISAFKTLQEIKYNYVKKELDKFYKTQKEEF